MTNVENMRLWVEALRSGLYTQTNGKLSDGTDYCCLGVACEVAMANGVELDRVQFVDEGGDIVTYSGERASLPQEVSEWLGLPRCCPGGDLGFCDMFENVVRVDGGTTSVVTLNDHLRWTFDQIADAVEKEHLGG